MSIQTSRELEALKAIGKIVGLALRETAAQVRPGITTAELDEISGPFLAVQEAQSAPRLVFGFRGSVCIGVNDEAVHGVPVARVIRDGDLVEVDVTVEKGGYMAGAAATVAVGPVSERARGLARCASRAFDEAMRAARAANRVRARIGRPAGGRLLRGLGPTGWPAPSGTRFVGKAGDRLAEVVPRGGRPRAGHRGGRS